MDMRMDARAGCSIYVLRALSAHSLGNAIQPSQTQKEEITLSKSMNPHPYCAHSAVHAFMQQSCTALQNETAGWVHLSSGADAQSVQPQLRLPGHHLQQAPAM